ncbi:ISL3 family transposase [Brachybacterium tyrofermentans]|uniref:ISL3 family transposase n=1 Tax=Brachybacterium tyrofermentans TaxID=47848 RepID=UPI003F8F7E63
MPTYRGGRHEHGQNFLTDPSTIATITRLVAATEGPIIEIGPGDGALTTPLAQLGRPVTAVEIDTRLAQRLTQRLPSHVEVVAMDGFSSFKTATAEELPEATAVMDPFHVVALAGEKVDQCRQRVQQATLGHRGRSGDPLYGIRRVLHTGADLLTDKQITRLKAVFASDEHVEVEATWGVYQRIVAAYRHPDRAAGKRELQAVIDDLTDGVPKQLKELITLGRTLKRRALDVLAYFDHPGTSNGPTEAINGRLEHLRGTALGFRNLAHYVIRALLDTGGFRTELHRHL